MSTICKILVANTDKKKIETIVYKHMIEVHGNDIQVEEADWPIGDYELFLSDEIEPTIYCLKVLDHSFTELQFNSFGSNQALSEKISKEMNTSVVVIIYQSTAEFCYWAYYQNGEQKRVIAYGDGNLLENDGKMLPFETEPLGHCIGEEGEEKVYIFDTEDMETYTKAVGINAFVYHDFDKGWKIIKCHSSINSGISKLSIDRKKKPWWKFWKKT
jgi:hypothetical protein